MAPTIARRMWTLFEPIHAVSYFAPPAREHFEAVGLRGFWRGYFGGRSAPLGAVGPEPIIAAFFGFAPAMVRRALPDVWTRATPQQALAAREAGAVASLRTMMPLSEAQLVEAADRLTEAADLVDIGGRVLAAANTALPVPEEPTARLWRAATILREHRGDGHVAALVGYEFDGCEALVWRSGIDLDRGVLQAARGWTDEQWAAAHERLVARGWLNADGGGTHIGNQARQSIERITDNAASRPWRALGDAATERLVELLTPIAVKAHEAIPMANPIGLPAPGAV
jgi:hypothetical protein